MEVELDNDEDDDDEEEDEEVVDAEAGPDNWCGDMA